MNARPLTPQVQCDLCQGVMSVPAHCVEDGEIIGLLVCGQCTEDILDAATLYARTEVGMVGTGGCR